MAFVEQSVRRNDAVEILQRRSSRRGKILRQVLWNVFYDILLEPRRRSIKLTSHGIARRLHPFRDVGRKVVGTFACLQRFASGKTACDNGPTCQCTTITQKSPAGRHGNSLFDVGWFGHRTSFVGKQRAVDREPRFSASHLAEPSNAPLAEDCCSCVSLLILIGAGIRAAVAVRQCCSNFQFNGADRGTNLRCLHRIQRSREIGSIVMSKNSATRAGSGNLPVSGIPPRTANA
jgi:hypothetical protein